MTKPIVIDFNGIQNVTEEDDYDYIVIPKKSKEGVQLPKMYLYDPNKKRRKVTPKIVINIRNRSTIEWHPKIPIDTKVPPNEYKAMVDWWFEKARENQEYSNYIVETFSSFKEGVLRAQTLLAMGWLKKTGAYSVNSRTQKFNKRRTDIDSFLINWLTGKLNDKRLTKQTE